MDWPINQQNILMEKMLALSILIICISFFIVIVKKYK